MLRLIMRRGPTPGAIYELAADEITIGRGSKNHIIIRDTEVSREHCRLTRIMDAYEVRDLGSSNGTFVNGQRVNGGFILEPGAILELGDSITLEYERVRMRMVERPPVTDEEDTQPTVNFAYRVMMTHGVITGRVFELNEAIITVGRDLSNDIVVQDPEVSRYQVRLRRVRQGYSIEDMGSTNGTFVNGIRLAGPIVLNHDDVVKLGSTIQMQFVADLLPPLDASAEDTGATQPATDSQPARPPHFHRDETLHGQLLRGVRSQVKTSRLGNGLEQGKLKNHIFIAYARDDWEDIVAGLTLTLQDAGMDVWVDQYLVIGSDDWRAAIEQGLLECRLMILVATPQGLADSHVRMAYRHFLGRQRPLLVLIHNLPPPLPDDLAGLRTIAFDLQNPRRAYSKIIFEALHFG